jgi:hypothetical protein
MCNVIAELEEELSNPPTILEIQLRLKRDHSEALEKYQVIIVKWAVTALYFTNKVFSSKCQTYYSLRRYNQEFMTHE